MESSCDILILTAGFGHGHKTASKAIIQHLKRADPRLIIEILDFYEFMNPLLYKSIYKGYELLIKTNADVYNFFYDLYNERDYQILQDFVFANKSAQNKINDFIKLKNPKLMVSTFPSCSGYLSMHKKLYNGKYRLITCITDVTSSKEWLHDETDLYLVASRIVKEQLIHKGVPQKRIAVTGIPIRESFTNPQASPTFPLNHVMFDPKRRIILFMGGGIGVLPKDASFYDWLYNIAYAQPVILTGTNKDLYTELKHTLNEKAIVLGYTDQIAGLMRHADIIVSKAGGITLYESIYCELPMIIYKPILKQEVENSEFITHQGLGLVANDLSQLKDRLYSCLYHDSVYQELQLNIRQLKQEINMKKLAAKMMCLYHSSNQ